MSPRYPPSSCFCFEVTIRMKSGFLRQNIVYTIRRMEFSVETKITLIKYVCLIKEKLIRNQLYADQVRERLIYTVLYTVLLTRRPASGRQSDIIILPF